MKTVTNGDHDVFVISLKLKTKINDSNWISFSLEQNQTSIEKNRTRIKNQRDHQKKEDFDRISASIDEISIENICVLVRR